MSDDTTTPEQESSGLSRRRLLQAAGVAGIAAAGAAAMSSGTASAAPMQPFRPRGKLRKRPNFLIIMMDEQRYAPVYESETLKAWRLANLSSQNFLRSHSTEFTYHHIMSTACQPSRASMYTGQYPSLHGVSQTSGSAKASIEKDLYWLTPATVPTLGNWMRAAGYDTYWKGKWHVSDADLYQPGSWNPLPSYTDTGKRDPWLETIYEEAGMLENYGFTGFIGPEPHGSNPLNSASSGPGGEGRDEVIAQWNVETLQKLRGSDNPWLLVASFVNPHDITLWGDLTVANGLAGGDNAFYLAQQLVGSNVPHDLFTSAFDTSANEDLSAKPSAQSSYVGQYPKGFQPLTNRDAYHRFYYQMQKNVDEQIGKVINALTADREMYNNTIIIYMSDHGDVLGAHGGMFQKWHNSYDEMMRVPFIFHNPQLFPRYETSDVLTSHADIIPTILGLAGLDEAALAKELRKTHMQVRPLVGRDLSGYLLGEESGAQLAENAIYFMTDDLIFQGAQAVSVLGTTYQPVVQPACVESVVTWLPTGANGERERWKYVRYWDNPQFWSDPNVEDVYTFVPGMVDKAGPRPAVTTVKKTDPSDGEIAPPADQFEMYNVSVDPTEQHNLYGNGDYAGQQAILAKLLDKERSIKRLTPTMQPWADGTAQQFPYAPN